MVENGGAIGSVDISSALKRYSDVIRAAGVHPSNIEAATNRAGETATGNPESFVNFVGQLPTSGIIFEQSRG